MREESSSGTVLFVSPGPELVTPASGEGTRLKHLSRELDAEGWTVLTLVPDAVSEARPDWVQRQYTYRQWSLPFLTDLNPSFIRALARVLRRAPVDVVHLSHGVCTARALSTLLRTETHTNYASQNVEAVHARDFVDPDLPVYKRLLGPRLIPAIERATVRCADCVTTVSEADRDALIERYRLDETRVRAIPTGTTVIDQSSLEARETVRARYGIEAATVGVFHGSYAHPPNAEAVELLVETVMPALRERNVDIEMLLVGKGMPAVDAPDVTAAGFVEDLFSTLNGADFAVVPIRHGGGTKTKIYDYLSLGLPIVSTTKGVEGIDIEDGVHGLVTDDVDETFIEAVCHLTRDGETRESFAEAVREFADQRTWEQSGRRLSQFYRDLLEAEPSFR